MIIGNFETLLGNGSQFGIDIKYAIQESPNGIAEAFIIGENFIKDSLITLILGDNIFHGSNLTNLLKDSFSKKRRYNFRISCKGPRKIWSY